jgi:hypothetical protein
VEALPLDPTKDEPDPYRGKLLAAERLIEQGYVKRDSSGRVYLTKRGTKAIQQFTGGPLIRDSFDLDAAYYGAVHANKADEVTWALDFLTAYQRMRDLAYNEGATLHPDIAELEIELHSDIDHGLSRNRPKSRSTVYWMRYFHELDEPSLERLCRGGWESVVTWRVDVARAVAMLPKSRQRVFALYAEGWHRDRIASALGPEGGEGWTSRSVNDVVKAISRAVRGTTNMTMAHPDPLDEPVPTSAANRTEDAIKWARARKVA